MTEESAKQMTCHKNGKRYNPDKMVHASDGEAWKHFDDIHREKAKEARNVRVALATDGFNPYGMTACRVELFLSPALCKRVSSDHDCRLGKDGTRVTV